MKLAADKPLRESKKAIVLAVALTSIIGVWFIAGHPQDLASVVINAILFLVGIWFGVQGGVEMVQSNNFSAIHQVNETILKEDKIFRCQKLDPKDVDDGIDIPEGMNIHS